MAVYTKVTEEELSEFIAPYDIGKLVTCKGIEEGIENTNYKITTTDGHYILTLYEKRVDLQDLPYFLELMQHLSKNGIACPKPLQTSDGTLSGFLCARPAALFTFLPGNWPRTLTPHHCHELGAWLAKLHNAGRGFDSFRANKLSISSWRPLLETCDPTARDDLAKGLYEDLTAELDFLEKNWPDQLPSGIIHADLFPDNAFFEGERLSGMIDFYFACNDSFAYDLAICLNAWCFDENHEFIKDQAVKLVEGYTNVRSLSRSELKALPVLARGAAIRFMLTRLYDWVNTPSEATVNRKSPSEFLTKLKFHQTITTVEDYGIRNT